MKHVCVAAKIGADAKDGAEHIANIGKGSDNAMGQNSCQPEGLQPKPAARRSG